MAAPEFTVRAAGFADLPALRHLYRQFLAERPGTSYPAMDGDELDALVRTLAVQFTAQQPVFVVLGAWTGERPVVFLGLEIGERAVGRPHRVLNAHWLYVMPDVRGLGIASRLIVAARDWLGAHHPDITHVEWFAAADDPQWSQRGYRPFLTRYAASVEAIMTPRVVQPPVEAPVQVAEPAVDLAQVNGSRKNGKPPKHTRAKRNRRTQPVMR